MPSPAVSVALLLSCLLHVVHPTPAPGAAATNVLRASENWDGTEERQLEVSSFMFGTVRATENGARHLRIMYFRSPHTVGPGHMQSVVSCRMCDAPHMQLPLLLRIAGVKSPAADGTHSSNSSSSSSSPPSTSSSSSPSSPSSLSSSIVVPLPEPAAPGARLGACCADTSDLFFPYERACLASLGLLRPSAKRFLAVAGGGDLRFLVIGLGAGSLPMFLRDHFPDAAVTAVEISGPCEVPCEV